LTPKHPTSWRIGGVRFNRMKQKHLPRKHEGTNCCKETEFVETGLARGLHDLWKRDWPVRINVTLFPTGGRIVHFCA
jgi:hypothetical protein